MAHVTRSSGTSLSQLPGELGKVRWRAFVSIFATHWTVRPLDLFLCKTQDLSSCYVQNTWVSGVLVTPLRKEVRSGMLLNLLRRVFTSGSWTVIMCVLPSTWECPGHEIRGSKQNLKAPHECCLNIGIKSRRPWFSAFQPFLCHLKVNFSESSVYNPVGVWVGEERAIGTEKLGYFFKLEKILLN